MPSLADLQKRIREALVLSAPFESESVLVGGHEPDRRLGVHQRHYRSTLVRTLVERFPATVWLVGSPFVTTAAAAFVRHQPPTRPCLAEYGEEFPAWLATRSGAAKIAYLNQFAELEWHLGRLALAVDAPALTMRELSASHATDIGDSTVALQPGVHYLHANWPVDELISVYLSDRGAPDRFTLGSGDLWLELRGVRGNLWMNRLSHAEFAFRAALVAGQPLADAALSAIEVEPSFAPGPALSRLIGDKLVVAIRLRGDA